MADYKEGIKREVAEIKFLIHDLRVERFINEVIHYHVTVNTDLEIYSIEQAQFLHEQDLQELKDRAVELRRAYQDYTSAVKNFSPEKTVLLTGRRYITAMHDICDLIAHPLWGRIDRVLSFLPKNSHSFQLRSHYRNCVRWVSGVQYRIKGFIDEQDGNSVRAQFDAGADLTDFGRNVVQGYVTEKSGGRCELRLDRADSAVVDGNPHRFRRMFFNLVMNAVDAMNEKRMGQVRVSAVVAGSHLVLEVVDNGAGMPEEKIRELLTDKETLDGELHSLGFVFVRQTVADLGGELAIDSKVGAGTTITVRLPFLAGVRPPPPQPSPWARFNRMWGDDGLPPLNSASDRPPPAPGETPKETPKETHGAVPAPGRELAGKRYGELILAAYRASESQHPGAIFAMAITEQDEVDCFTHRAYERYWNVTHEDLAPTFFQATVRGRLEEDDEKNATLILKSPQNVGEYFDFKNVADAERSAERYVQMVHDEYVRIAQRLIGTGLPEETKLYLSDAARLFPNNPEIFQAEPIALALLAGQALIGRPAEVKRKESH